MKNILSAVVVMGILLTGCPSKQVEKVTEKTVVTTVDAGTKDIKPVVVGPIAPDLGTDKVTITVEKK